LKYVKEKIELSRHRTKGLVALGTLPRLCGKQITSQKSVIGKDRVLKKPNLRKYAAI
jgi:hypothetical protein